MLTVDEVKQLLQIPDGPLATGFYTASGSSIGYGSPVLASRNGLIDKAENKKPYPNGYKFYGTVIAPIAQRDEGTGLAAGSLFTRTIVTRQTVKLWEEDSFINYLEVNAVDDISEINYFKSLPDVLRERGMLCIVPNNMKATEQLISAGRELINAYNFSMLYSYDARVAMESVGGNSAYYFQSGLRRSKYTVLIPLLLIIDIKYCIPFYDFNSNTGLLYAWQFFVMNGERAERCSNFSFFVSSTEEGITVVDSERVFDSVETVKDIYFEDWLSKALTTMPFLPSLIETKNKKKPEKILQSRSKKKLKTTTIKISKDVSPKLKSASDMSVDVYEEVAKAKEPHEIKNMMSDSHEELFYKTRGIEQPIEQPIEAMKVSMPRTARNKPIRLNPYDEDRFRKNLKGPKCSTSKSEMFNFKVRNDGHMEIENELQSFTERLDGHIALAEDGVREGRKKKALKLKTEKFKKAYSASTAYAKSYRVDAAAEVDRMKKKADEEILNVLKRTNAEIKKVEDSNNDE